MLRPDGPDYQLWPEDFGNVMQPGSDSVLPLAPAFGATQRRGPLLFDPLAAEAPGGPDTPPQQLQLVPSSTPSRPPELLLPCPLLSMVQQQTQPPLAPPAAPPRAGRQPRSRASRTRAPQPKKPRGVWLAMARFAQSRFQAAAPEVATPAADNAAELQGHVQLASGAAGRILSAAANDTNLQASDTVASVDFNVPLSDVHNDDQLMEQMVSVFMPETVMFDPANM